MDNRKYRLNSAKSQFSVNEDTFDKINIESKSNVLPIGEINKIINVGEQFNKERQTSPYYRLTGTLNTFFNNVLFNNTSNNSWKTFNENIFRDASFPPNGLNLSDGDLTYSQSILKHLKENNGWFGYYDPRPENATLCTWIDMEPNRNLFSLTPKSGIKNWEITITYPTKINNLPGDLSHNLVLGGLLIVDVFESVIGDRNVLTFTTATKHGLSQGDSVELSNLSDYNTIFSVIRLGKNNGDDKEYNFSVDIPELINITPNSRMSRIVNGRKSLYYFRMFKKINVKGGNIMENDDYEVYPLAFSQNIYEDKIPQFVINEDIDITDLVDNLDRPLSEIYLTIIKTDSGGVFTSTKSGINIPFSNSVGTNSSIPDINRIVNNVSTHIPLEDDIKIDSELFYGDLVEYNVSELKETVLADVYHRFNSFNRETSLNLVNVNFSGNSDILSLKPRYEGYVYKAHHKIKIREFSNYIEEGTSSTLNKPSYAINLRNGKFIWRDLLNIGSNDTQETILDYPFLNGVHYINSNFNLFLKRQDPFGFYGLRYRDFPQDISGELLEDKIIIKRNQDVC